MNKVRLATIVGLGVVGAPLVWLALAQAAAPAPTPGPFTFFVTSKGSGKGADLGGLAGADAICQSLATSVNAGARTWRAYLSTQAVEGQPAVNARDRIGTGPWYNAKGEIIAQNVADLHGDLVRDRNNINKASVLNEKGEMINGRGDTPNRHDILTGSQSDGRAWPAGTNDTTCRNWTSSTDGSATVGHHDRSGGNNSSWNQAHGSRGCSQENLASSGGDGLLYCFAIN